MLTLESDAVAWKRVFAHSIFVAPLAAGGALRMAASHVENCWPNCNETLLPAFTLPGEELCLPDPMTVSLAPPPSPICQPCTHILYIMQDDPSDFGDPMVSRASIWQAAAALRKGF